MKNNDLFGELFEIQSHFEVMQKKSCVPIGIKKLKEGYIFDEDKSVKWNREKVESNNKKYQDEVARLNREKNALRDEVENELFSCIQKYVGNGIEKAQAREIWMFVQKHYATLNTSAIQMLMDTIEMLQVVMQPIKKGTKKEDK